MHLLIGVGGRGQAVVRFYLLDEFSGGALIIAIQPGEPLAKLNFSLGASLS
jgi:hypothetical protein